VSFPTEPAFCGSGGVVIPFSIGCLILEFGRRSMRRPASESNNLCGGVLLVLATATLPSVQYEYWSIIWISIGNLPPVGSVTEQ